VHNTAVVTIIIISGGGGGGGGGGSSRPAFFSSDPDRSGRAKGLFNLLVPLIIFNNKLHF
jgi:hypothetical protein